MTDSEGARAARYKLYYLGSSYAQQESWVFGMLTGMFYWGFKAIAIVANGLLGIVLSSGRFLDPLSQGYQRVTAPLYEVIPPWGIACFGLAIVAVSVFWSRPKTTTGGLFDSASLDRLGTALAMMVLVVVLTHNPFALIQNVLGFTNGLSVGGTAAITHSAHDTTITAGQALADSSIRTPSIALNYDGEFTEACKTAWSKSMAAGVALQPDSGCFTKGQNVASADTVGTAFLMLVLTLPMLVFAVIGTWKFVLHMSMAVICTLASGWAAADGVRKRRGFDQLGDIFARAGAHSFMAVIASIVTVALPTLVAGIAADVLGLISDAEAQAFVQTLTLAIGFMVSTLIMHRITSNHGALVRVLKADAKMTLERTLGVSTGPLQLQLQKFNPLARNQATTASVPTTGSALSAEPRAFGQGEGNGTMKSQNSTDASAAVEQLLAPAQSVAQAITDPRMAQVHLTAAAPVECAPRTDALAGSAASMFGFFSTSAAGDSSRVPPHPQQLGDAVQPPFPSDDPTSTVPAPPDTAQSVGESAPHVPDQSHLAEPQYVSRTSAPETLIAPVPGNLFIDPALNAAARAASATFTLTGDRPVAKRVRFLLRRFRSQEPLDPVPFGAPSVEHGAALQILTAAESASVHPQTAITPIDSPTASDQQAWNRRNRFGLPRKEIERTVTSSLTPEPVLVSSGMAAGVNRHPASFQAPLPDFLASAQLAADIEETVATFAAAGQSVRVSMPTDRRTALRLTSDPDQRVVPISGIGFGDPV